MIKSVVLHIIGFILLIPCLLIVNESEDCDLTLNFIGLCWIVILFILAHTKLGRWYIKELMETQKNYYNDGKK